MTTLLVDAHNLAYRAWFNRERREDPEAAAALFVAALRAEATDTVATRRIAAVERSRSFRFRLFEGYKSGRKERAPELKAFIEGLPALAHQAGYEVWHSPDHEADDVMATFARQLSGEIYIVTTDRDLCACVCDRVKVLLPAESGGERVTLDVEGVRRTLGVEPGLVPLYKALVGDPSDGIPGVKGLGKVKAAPLLEQFDSLDALYGAYDTLDPNIQALLSRTPRQDVELFHRLTTLVSAAPLERLTVEEPARPAALTPLPVVGPTPTWGIHWHGLEKGAEDGTPEDQILAFLHRHPPPPAAGLEQWTEDWRDETGGLNLSEVASFGWCLKVLADPECPPEILEELTLFEDLRLDRMIAWHGRCPPTLLAQYRASQDAATSKGAWQSPDRKARLWPDLSGMTEDDAHRVSLQLAGSEDDVPFHLARNPTTPPAVLKKLGRHEDVAVRLALASGTRFAGEFMQLGPTLEKDTQLAVREALAANPHTAKDILYRLASDRPEVQRVLAKNRSIDSKTLSALLEVDDLSVQRSLAHNLSFAQLWKLSGVSSDSRLIHPLDRPVYFWWSWNVAKVPLLTRLHTALHGAGALPQLSRLVEDSDPAVRINLARNPSCPKEILARLAQDQSPAVRRAVAVHSACPEDVRERLKLDPHWHVRRMAAHDFGSEMITQSDLTSLPWYVAFLLASHPSCPPEVLETLGAGKNDWRVKLAVGRHSACPEGVLRRLAEDGSWTSRTAVAGNAHTPPDVLARLTRDKELDVRVWAATQASCSPQALDKMAFDERLWELRLAAAAHPEAPQDMLERLAEDSDLNVRQAVARNPRSSMAVLEKMAAATSMDVRKAVLRNPVCPEEVLWLLSEDQGWSVRQGVASHPRCPSDLLERLGEDDDDDVRAAVADHPQAAPELLRHLSEAEESKVRRAVAGHPKCPPEVLAELAFDENAYVREAVARNHEALSWAERCGEDDLDLDFLAHLTDDEEPCVRLALLYQPESRRPKTLALALRRGNLKELGPWLSEHLDVPPDVLVAGFSHLPDEDDVHVARRDDLPLEVIEQLKESGDPQCAFEVLNTQHVPVELAEELDEAASTFACMAYARHVGLPSTAWLKLPPELTALFWQLVTTPEVANPLTHAAVNADDWRVRAAAASHRNLPPHWLTALSVDSDSDVRLSVAGNPATPPGVLLSLLRRGLDKGNDAVCQALASQPGLPERGMFELLQRTDSESVLRSLARNVAIPDHVQLFLASDVRPAVRRGLKTHPLLTPEAQLRLSAF